MFSDATELFTFFQKIFSFGRKFFLFGRTFVKDREMRVMSTEKQSKAQKEKMLRNFLIFILLPVTSCVQTTFAIRKQKFTSCDYKQLNHSQDVNDFSIQCLESKKNGNYEFCFQTCNKCASSSLRETMRENELRYVRVQNCNFGGITSLAIFTRPIIDRFMSGYAQIAYFEAKHVRKRFSNEYESLSVYRDPEARFEKFLSAYSMASTRAKIPLLNHIETMMTDYNPIKYCFNKQLKYLPKLYILSIPNIAEEWNELRANVNIPLKNYQFSQSHSATRFKKNCAKCAIQYKAKNTKVSESQKQQILRLWDYDVECFQ